MGWQTNKSEWMAIQISIRSIGLAGQVDKERRARATKVIKMRWERKEME